MRVVLMRMVRLRFIFLANVLGSAWALILQVAFVPAYVRILGMEAYGLIGIYTALQAWMAVLDMGMTPTLTRETARSGAMGDPHIELRDLLSTLELVMLGIAGAQWILLWAGSGWLASHWFQLSHLPLAVVSQAIALIGGMLATRWISGLYRGGLMGLQKQIPLNISTSVFATLRVAGVIPILIWISPTISAFFIFQASVSLLEVLFLRTWLWKCLPGQGRYRMFSLKAFQRVSGFAGGMTVITLFGTVLTQMDKILLSKLLPMAQFGQYALANTVAASLLFLVTPVTGAFLPRLTQLACQADPKSLSETYHRGSRLMSTLLFSAGVPLAVFSDVILSLWLHDQALAAAISPILRLLLIGTVLNGILHMPFHLQVAHGWTKLPIVSNGISVAILVPVILLLVPRYGLTAAAACWVALNVGQFFIVTPLLHRRILKNELWAWVWGDTGKQAFLAIGTALACRVLWNHLVIGPSSVKLGTLLLMGSITLGVTGLFGGVLKSVHGLPDVESKTDLPLGGAAG